MSWWRVKSPTSEFKTWVVFWYFPHLCVVALAGGAHKQTSHTEGWCSTKRGRQRKKKRTSRTHGSCKASKQPSCLRVGEKPREKALLSEQSLNHLLSLVSVRTPCKVKGSLGSKTPTSQRTRHCTVAPPCHCGGKRQSSGEAASHHNKALWHNAALSLQGLALGFAHSDVGQRFSPVGCGQSESLEGCQCLVQTVPHPHSLLVAAGGHTSHLLEPWGERIPQVALHPENLTLI